LPAVSNFHAGRQELIVLTWTFSEHRTNVLISVTDCVAVPELRLLVYYSVTVNYGAQKRCYGRLKRCYGWTYKAALARRAGPPPVNTLILAILPDGLHGIPDTTFFYATHVRDTRSNCNERLVSNNIDLSRVRGPCCGMSYRLTIPLVLDATYACARGSIRAGRCGKNFGGCDAVTQ
jgi:hypothetical protein